MQKCTPTTCRGPTGNPSVQNIRGQVVARIASDASCTVTCRAADRNNIVFEVINRWADSTNGVAITIKSAMQTSVDITHYKCRAMPRLLWNPPIHGTLSRLPVIERLATVRRLKNTRNECTTILSFSAASRSEYWSQLTTPRAPSGRQGSQLPPC